MMPLLQVEYNFEEWPVGITWSEDYMVCQVCGILPLLLLKSDVVGENDCD